MAKSLAQAYLAFNQSKSCYEHALQAEQSAAQAQNPWDRRFWRDSHARWLALAASYEYQTQLADFIKEVRGFVKSPLCSTCDLPMRPKRIVQSDNRLFEFQYECANCRAKKRVSELHVRPGHNESAT